MGCGALTARRRSWADSMSLHAIATPGGPRAWALGDSLPKPHGGEGRLNRVGRAEVNPVLGGAVLGLASKLHVVILIFRV